MGIHSGKITKITNWKRFCDFCDFGSKELMEEHEFENEYKDIPGLCKKVTIDKIEEQNYSLNPGRYVGIKEKEEDDLDFKENMIELHEKLEELNIESHKIEKKIHKNIKKILTVK